MGGYIQNAIIVDDEVSRFNKEVLDIKTLNGMTLDASYVALYISHYKDFADLLEERGVPFENIYNVKGDNLIAQDALIKCCEDKSTHTVLDVGCGRGNHSRIFGEYGKKVTGTDLNVQCRGCDAYGFVYIRDNFMEHVFDEQYDLIWCSHALEHQIAVGDFIRKLFSCCKQDGKVAITVPNDISGFVTAGHVSVWNVELLMYNIIECGYSCQHTAVKSYASNVSVIVPKEQYSNSREKYAALMDSVQYFPENIVMGKTRFGRIYFDGNIEELNWD